ncbi:oligopeptide transport ATP-binding protein OppD [Mesobacillus boroniphilus JCM 21738]|uniref:Oligopeptide transport ATP-binding protein OppD n=1 Tax=Mesobacillus boroniphilus JCM 21738 TaxID=1294265 RepID=W4RJT1_9BACI|nr:oligopeptide transport ATP-binding protein OppD [Mesobacillus boroniphilus JCM 21738]
MAQVADRIAVMYAGKIVETGTRREIFYNPQHPYTKGLLNSVPRLDVDGAELIPIAGTPPDLFSPPVGCPFTARCPYAMEVCDKVYPTATKLSESHGVDCWFQDERAKKLLASR